MIRADVVGSLLRPAHLLDARGAFFAGMLSSGELKRLEDRAVDEAIAMQEAAGRGSRSRHAIGWTSVW